MSNKSRFVKVIVYLFMLFSINGCDDLSKVEESIVKFLEEENNSLFLANFDGVLFVPLEGCSCTKYAAKYFKENSNKNILFIFSAYDRKFIRMNIGENDASNLIIDNDNKAVKMNIVKDYAVIYRIESNRIKKSKEINAEIAKYFFEEKGIEEYLLK